MSNHHSLASLHGSGVFSLERFSPVTSPTLSLLLSKPLVRTQQHISYGLRAQSLPLFSAHRLAGHSLSEWPTYVHVAACVDPQTSALSGRVCVCVLALVCDNGPCPSAHRARALCIRQKTHLMPVTGSDQVCTKEN